MIRILDRYIARDFLKLFGLALTVLVALSVLVNLFEKLHRYVAWGASTVDVMAYYFYTLPREILHVSPIAFLIASFLSVARLSRNFEFLAMQMARLHPIRAVLSIILLALAITAGLYAVQEDIAPGASETALRIRYQRIRKDSAFHRTRSNDIWYLAGPDRILHIGLLKTRKGEMHQVSLFQFSPEFALLERTDAARGHWEAGRWVLSEARIRRFSGGGTDVSVTEVPEMPIQLKATPEDLARIEKKVEEMSYKELKRYIRRLTRSGVDAQHLVADLFAKPAMLAVNFIMVLLGIAFAFRVGRHGLFVHVGTCMAAAFLYWFVFSLALPLARNNVLPPLLVVWIPNVIFGGLALVGLLWSRPRI
ncbi:MAG: LPS export ABC transporter permease LptG [candidate division NC10 bacterium]|jgi:lipopolysaccharide export system permease protein